MQPPPLPPPSLACSTIFAPVNSAFDALLAATKMTKEDLPKNLDLVTVSGD